MFKSGKNLNYIRKCIQKNFKKISEWCDLWDFKISLEKTIAMVLSHRKDLDIQLGINSQQEEV